MKIEAAPIALVIAVQSAGISAAVIEKVQRIGAMIQPLVTGERGSAAVVSFDERVTTQPEERASWGGLETGEGHRFTSVSLVGHAGSGRCG